MAFVKKFNQKSSIIEFVNHHLSTSQHFTQRATHHFDSLIYLRESNMRFKTLALLTVALSLSLLIFNTLSATYAAGVVGTGTADSCTEGALDAALAGGGAITFNCGASPVVINVLKEKDIAQNTTIDGGGLVTISGRNATRVFKVGTGITLEIHKLTVAYGAAN